MDLFSVSFLSHSAIDCSHNSFLSFYFPHCASHLAVALSSRYGRTFRFALSLEGIAFAENVGSFLEYSNTKLKTLESNSHCAWIVHSARGAPLVARLSCPPFLSCIRDTAHQPPILTPAVAPRGVGACDLTLKVSNICPHPMVRFLVKLKFDLAQIPR